MKISYNWLQDYFEKPLPLPEQIAELLTAHSFEVESVEKAGADTVLDVKILPDRSHDCLCHRGVAMEVSLLTGVPMKSDIRTPLLLSVPESNVLKVEVEDPKLCKRFSALVIENVVVKESPAWLRERLEAIGQRSINNVVDATNYVMFSLGQPLHAYDRALLKEVDGGWKMGVRKAKEGEKVLALGEKEYALKEGNLVITDENANTILGIAAIRGGVATKISKQTKNIVLESANFDAVYIRKTAKALGVRTDASVRFENEITPELTMLALKMVADLILDIAGTEETQVEGVLDVYPKKSIWKYSIGISAKEVNELLGTSFDEKSLDAVIKKINFPYNLVGTEEVIKAAIPSVLGKKYKSPSAMREDAPNFFSCSSLVSYLYNLAGIWMPSISIDKYVYGEPIEKSDVHFGDLIFALTPGGSMYVESKEWMHGTKVPEGIDHVGMMISPVEVLHSSRHNPEGTRVESLESFLKTHELRGFRRIPALSEGKRFVVTIPPERLDLRLKADLIEEIGRVYGYQNMESKPIKPFEKNVEINKKEYWANKLREFFVGNGYSEVITYVFRKNGEVELQNPIASDKSFLRSNLMDGLAESLVLNTHNADLLGLEQIKIFEIGNVFPKEGEHTSAAFTGENSKEIQEKLEKTLGAKLTFNDNGYELNLDLNLDALAEPKEPFVYQNIPDLSFKPFSSYPFVLRDIAVFVKEGADKNVIINTLKEQAGDLLASYRLFDTFEKEFPQGKMTSYAYRLAFQSFDRTLTDLEVTKIMEKVTEIVNRPPEFLVR